MTVLTPDDSALPETAIAAFSQGASLWLESDSAHAALWLTGLPPVPGRRVGSVGSFAAPSSRSAHQVLTRADDLFREHRLDYVIGPMNGNTWRSHRLVIESTGRPPFLFEPRNPAQYVDYFGTAGYQTISRYSSGLIDLHGPRPELSTLEEKIASRGITLRSLDPNHFERDLSAIFEVSLASFGRNFLYTPLDREDFMALYARARDQIVPALVRLAVADGQVVGFMFALPDHEAVQHGAPPALILKTLAVLPERRLAGLGTLLVDQVQQTAKSMGFSEAIHALQHESNSSLRVSGRFGANIFRRYALFAKDLT